MSRCGETIVAFGGRLPRIGSEVFLAPDSKVIGDVTLGNQCSVFFGAVLRGDILPISVGARTNIQEHALLHTSHHRTPTIVGSEVTVGHRAILHGCTVGDRALIGMGAIILDESVIGEECLVGAGALVTEKKQFPPRSLVLGSPAKVVRTLSEEEIRNLRASADSYVALGSEFRKYYGSPAPERE